MKIIKKIVKTFLYLLELVYFQIRYTIAYCSVIHWMAQIDKVTGAELPCEYIWGERYCLWVEYLRRRSVGIKCNYQQVEFEYLKKWNDEFNEARKKFYEERENEDNWWWI